MILFIIYPRIRHTPQGHLKKIVCLPFAGLPRAYLCRAMKKLEFTSIRGIQMKNVNINARTILVGSHNYGRS